MPTFDLNIKEKNGFNEINAKKIGNFKGSHEPILTNKPFFFSKL